MEKKIIMFENIVNEIMSKRGNRWNSKKHIDVTMLADELEFLDEEYEIYKPSNKEIDEIACYLYEAGIEAPCVVAVRKSSNNTWSILWGKEAGIESDGPIVFNARIVRKKEYLFNVIWDLGSLKEGELALSWTHLHYFDYDKEGYYAVYERCELCNSTFDYRKTPIPAKTVAVSDMLKKYPVIEDLKSIPIITEDDLENGCMLYEPVHGSPCFIMIGGKLLCTSHKSWGLPYLFNAEGYKDDSYAAHKEGDLFVREHKWDTDGGIGIRHNEGLIYDWR